MPTWKNLQLEHSKAIVIEAASRIASQLSQDTHMHRFALGTSEATAQPSQPNTHRSDHLSFVTQSQSSFSYNAKATERPSQPIFVTHKVELGNVGSLALKSLKKSDACFFLVLI